MSTQPTKLITPEPPDLDNSIELSDAPSKPKDNTTYEHRNLNNTFTQPITARSITFDQCKFTSNALTASMLPSSRWTDCIIQSADLSNATWIDAGLIRVQITNTKLTGFDARGAELRDLQFTDCKAPDILLTEAALTRVRFDQCQLTSLDLAGAKIKSLAINNCDARNLRLIDAKIDHLDLSNSLIENIAINPAQLKGITITPTQAPALTVALGVNVIDE